MADPGGFIALLPVLLGFAPQEALVVATVCARPPHHVRHVLSVRLDQSHMEACSRLRPLLALACAEEEPAAFVVAIFEEGGALRAQRKLCARFARTALPVGARLSAAFSAPSAAPGAPWQSVLGPRCRGFVAAPRQVGSRDQLRERLGLNSQRRARVVRAARRLRNRQEAVPAAERAMLSLIRRPPPSVAISPAQAARFAAALCERGVRDRLISATVAAALGSRAQDRGSGAERLWSCLVPMLPDDSRAEAALLLALDSYARGKGAAASIALEVVLAANPSHELAQLLQACLFTGVRPEALEVLIQS